MRWRSFAYVVLALGCAVGAYFLVWIPCVGSVLALAAIPLALASIVSGVRARRLARREGVPAGVATAGLVTGTAALPIVVVTALGCATLNVAITVVSAAVTLAPAAVLPLLPEAEETAPEDDHGRAMSFWNGGYAGDWVPTDVGETEDEGDVRRTIRLAWPLVVLAALVTVALAGGDDDGSTAGSHAGPDAEPSVDGGA